MSVIAENKPAVADSEDVPKRSWATLGIGLILLSGVFFFLMCALPWIYVGDLNKWLLGVLLYVGVQLSWWIGAAMLGPSAVVKMWRWFFPKRID